MNEKVSGELSRAEAQKRSKILTVADVVEAMSSHRPYRPSLGVDKALDEIRSGRGTRYHAAECCCLPIPYQREKNRSLFRGFVPCFSLVPSLVPWVLVSYSLNRF